MTEQNFDGFMTRDPQKSKVLYFPTKKNTSAIMKSFSKKFLDKISLGEVRSDDELTKRFQIEEFPKLMVITDMEHYTG